MTEDILYRPGKESYFDESGKPKWKEFLRYADDFGFDKRYVGENGCYVQKIVLPAGKCVIRYGSDTGSFTTDLGTDYRFLSMPFQKESLPYHQYRVKKECEVLCFVDCGVVAPGFDSPGGAVQYRHYYTMYRSIKMGILEEDVSWIRNLNR